MQDAVPTGTIIVNKDGEFLQDARVLEEHWYDVIFQYFKKSLAGVAFKVYAAEDIVSPDGLTRFTTKRISLSERLPRTRKELPSWRSFL